MTIVITGTHGLIGTALRTALVQQGHRVVSLVRSAPKQPSSSEGESVLWDIENPDSLVPVIEGVDAIVHLAGHNVANRIRWNKEEKKKILLSRVETTRCITTAIQRCQQAPRTFVCASAVGIYGNNVRVPTDETASSLTRGFLSEVCREWEASALPAAERTRLVNARFGMVLSKEGGALKKMLLPFRLGLGGRIGSGTQWVSWVELGDVVRALQHLLSTDTVSGPVNIVAPDPIQNADFTKQLAKSLHRPAIFHIPEIVLVTLLGEFAEETLLSSSRIIPKVLLDSGFNFQHPTLEGALRAILQ